MKDYFKILNLPPNASEIEVKQAFRKLALEFHPDVCKLPDAGERFVEISLAYQSIMQKFEYDNKLKSRTSVENETAEEIINSWVKAERERVRKRAQKYANMPYNQFRKTNFYKSSVVFPKMLALFSLFFGMSIIFGSVYGTLNQYDIDPRIINVNYIGSAILIFLLGVTITSFAVSKLIPYLKKNHLYNSKKPSGRLV